MEQDIMERLRAQEAKIDAIWTSVEKTRKYFLVVMWVTIVMFVVPLIGLLFAVPAFLSMYLGGIDGL